MTRVKVLGDGCLFTETKDWDSYWKSLRELDCSETNESLGELRCAWSNYVQSGFSPVLRREYCFRYFALLDDVLSLFKEAVGSHPWIDALKDTLGFECFGVNSASNPEALGAGISTLRNPCYLLAKLKMPDVPDDPQFLPVVTVAGVNETEIFYHYRQYTLSIDSSTALMFYPAVSEAKRPASFRLINSLAGLVSYSVDPRTPERAKRLCRYVIEPIIEANHLAQQATACIEFVDVGAGSASLTSCICREIQRARGPENSHPKFRLWFVDLEPSDPVRFFRAKSLRGLVDNSVFLGCDYRAWLSEMYPLPPANGSRIAFVSRLFNNLSQFHISPVSEEESGSLLRDQSDSGLQACLPSVCLAAGGRGPESLLISNSRVTLRDGRTLAQASLMRFFEGLALLTTENPTDIYATDLFVPVRVFNPDCLLTLDGRSVISRLTENCDHVVIEDADLTPKDLIGHMTRFSLDFIAVQDMTKVLGLTGNHAYVIWSEAKGAEPNLPGERIW